jgi:hypothetical protein
VSITKAKRMKVMTNAKAPIMKPMLLVAGVNVKATSVGLVVFKARVDVRLFHVQFNPSGLSSSARRTCVGLLGNV